MRQRILLLFIVIALFASLFGLRQRLLVEKENTGVELIMDDFHLSRLTEETDGNKDTILRRLADNGLTGIAVFQGRVENLIMNDGAKLITGNEVKRMQVMNGSANLNFSDFPYNDDSAFMVITEQKIANMVLQAIPGWQNEFDIHYKLSEQGLIVFFPKWNNKYLHLSAGFNRENIEQIQQAGLKIIPRLRNDVPGIDQWEIIGEIDTNYIIFEGQEVLGYPDRLKGTAEKMENRGLALGLIEPFIANQEGAKELASLLDNRVIRVHSLQQEEMDKYDLNRIINRYLRAVKERNIRILYLKPALISEDKNELVIRNLNFVNILHDRLAAEDYNIGQAKYFSNLQHSLLIMLLAALGIYAAGLLLLDYLPGFNTKVIPGWLLMVLGLMGVAFLYVKGYGNLTGQVLALLSALIFPSLAIISQLLDPGNQRKWIIRFLLTIVISAAGGLLIAACLRHVDFLIQIEQFRGVKLAFILPLIIISWYYFYHYWQLKSLRSIVQILEKEIRVKHLLILLFLAVGGVFYIGRTGNFPFLPVPAWEFELRDWLGSFLLVRPRFKEFLIGHPALVISLFLAPGWRNTVYFFPLLLLAAIGQTTVVNTFTHIHTPLLISLLRLVNGLVLGLVLGLLVLGFLTAIKRMLKDE